LIAFMRMRSPSSAPPLLRRDGSIEITAMRSLSRWSRRKRRISSSVSDDLPAPPVPVMPSTGVLMRAAACTPARRRARRGQAVVLERGDQLRQLAPRALGVAGDTAIGRRGRRQVLVAVHHHLADHALQAHALAVLGAEDAHAGPARDLGRHDHAAAAAEHLDVLAAARLAAGRPCTEVLDMAALVGADGDALRVLLQRGVTTSSTDRLCPRWTTSAPMPCRMRRMMLIAASWPSNSAAAVTNRVMRVQQLLLARVEDALKPYGLTFAAYECLQLLAFTRSGSLPMGKMGVRLMVHPAAVTNAVSKLEQRGLVRRRMSPDDRRVVLAAITDEGRALAEEATAALNGVAFGLPGLSQQEAADMAAMLRTVRAVVGDIGTGHAATTRD
jgi:DNA-binding MarR family transcriptional regulator